MANGRNAGRKGDSGRDSGGFVALPWAVLDSRAYALLSHPARSLLVEIARQYVRDNNGKLLASYAHLSKRGWRSKGLIQRARDELLQAGFIHETVKGQRPNKAAWYAVTWYVLDRHSDYDQGAAAAFERSAYKNASLAPSMGERKRRIAPSMGERKTPPSPSMGAMRADFAPSPSPSMGDHLEMPSAGNAGAVPAVGLPAVQGRAPRSENLAPSTRELLEQLQRRIQQQRGIADAT